MRELINKLKNIDVSSNMKKCGWVFSLAAGCIIATYVCAIFLTILCRIFVKFTYLATFSTMQISISITVVFFIIYFVKNIFKDNPKEIFVFKKNSAKQIYFALILGLALFFLTNFFGNIVSTLLNSLHIEIYSFNSSPEVPSFPVFLLLIPMLCVLPVISDELIFRSAIMHYAKGTVFPIIFSALCFALMRFDLYQILQGFIAGLVYAIIYFRTKNIIMVMIVHFFTNFLTLLKVFLKIPFRNIFFGNSVVELVMFIIATSFFVYLFFAKENSEKKKRNPDEDGGLKDVFKTAEYGLILGIVYPIVLIILFLT